MHALTTSRLGGGKYDLQIMQRHLPQLWPLAKLIKEINIVFKNVSAVAILRGRS